MKINLEDPKERALLLSRITRGYELMAEEREMIVEMCNFISQEQAEMAELLDVAQTDIEELSTAGSGAEWVTRLSQQAKDVSQLCAESQQLLKKVAEIGGQDSAKHGSETVQQVISDVIQLRESQQENADTL